MSLRTTVAAPFTERGRDRLPESEFVVALSLNRDWFSPDQAKRLVDIAVSEGLLAREEDGLVPTFDLDGVTVPDDFSPSGGLLRERSTFERVLGRITDTGIEKRAAVAAINRRQADLAVTVETAALLYAHGNDIDVSADLDRALAELE